jgi:hypothetical protein
MYMLFHFRRHGVSQATYLIRIETRSSNIDRKVARRHLYINSHQMKAEPNEEGGRENKCLSSFT